MTSPLLRPRNLVLLACVALIGGTTAYAQTDYHFVNSVDIHAPPREVFDFMSDSSKAKDWSIIFHHLNATGGQDGMVGSKRRCFRFPDENAAHWDEEVLESTPYKTRLIRAYDATGILFADGTEEQVAHRYEEVSPGVTRLTFDARITKASPLQRVEILLGKIPTDRVFRLNLSNVRDMIEQKDKYQRKYAWEPHSLADK